MNMHVAPRDHSKIADAIGCDAESLGLKLGAAIKGWNQVDAATEAPANPRQAGYRVFEQRIEAFADAICFVECKSALGALAQLCIVSGSAGLLADHLSAEEKAYADYQSHRIEAALWAIRDFIEHNFDVDAQKVGSEHYMPRALRPAPDVLLAALNNEGVAA